MLNKPTAIESRDEHACICLRTTPPQYLLIHPPDVKEELGRHARRRAPASLGRAAGAGDDGRLAEVNVDADGEEEDGEEGEVDDGVDEDGEAAGLEVAELDDPALAGDLEEQARRQQDEEHQPDQHRPPVRHGELAIDRR